MSERVDDRTNRLLGVVVKREQLGETVPGGFLSADPHISSRNLPGTVVKVQRAAFPPLQRAVANDLSPVLEGADGDLGRRSQQSFRSGSSLTRVSENPAI